VVALKTKGIENAAALLGGFNLWQQEGKPIDRKQTAATPPGSPTPGAASQPSRQARKAPGKANSE
jgi:3-mercaptopyruvate sulfurtransferase SseA